jgi:hypothetical protein
MNASGVEATPTNTSSRHYRRPRRFPPDRFSAGRARIRSAKIRIRIAVPPQTASGTLSITPLPWHGHRLPAVPQPRGAPRA